jgi:hypothetical protein
MVSGGIMMAPIRVLAGPALFTLGRDGSFVPSLHNPVRAGGWSVLTGTSERGAG